MDKRILGTEIIEFVDGTKKDVRIHAIPSRKVNQFKTNARKTIWTEDKKDVKDIVFDETEFMYETLFYAMNKDDISKAEFDDMETDGLSLFKQYFVQYLNLKKKDNTSDAS